MSKIQFRKTLRAPGLLRVGRGCFDRIEEPVASRGLPLPDGLLSALALLGLKYAWLWRVEQDARGAERPRANLSSRSGVARAPSDTTRRARRDEGDPRSLRRAFKRVVAAWPRGGGRRAFTWLDEHDLVSVDGPGDCSAQTGHCAHCCERRHRDGRVTYDHQMLGAVRVPLEPREVVPLAPASIGRADGSRKNACARNAAKRLLRDGRRAPPPLKLVVVEDAVAANGPHSRLLPALDRRLVLGGKPGDHAEVFPGVAAGMAPRGGETQGADGGRRRDRLLNGGPLNAANCDLEVNLLECGATTPMGRARHFRWGTDIESTASNGEALRRAGRARGRLENEPCNTLKNHGCGVAHHLGPGTRPLAPGFAGWTLLAVLIDQLPPRGGARFGAARERAGRPQSCWARRRRVVLACFMPGGEARSRASACGSHGPALVPFDTSCPHRRGRGCDERVLRGNRVAKPLIRGRPEGEPAPSDPPTSHPRQNATPSAPQNGLAGLAVG